VFSKGLWRFHLQAPAIKEESSEDVGELMATVIL
jgi:hypothetical protein